MTRNQRLRRVGIVCCHCLRNLAFYRSGWHRDAALFNGQFWISVNGNFLDICVLEWCKLFADKRGKHHWEKVISDSAAFHDELLNALNATEYEFNAHIQEMKNYRDKFVAHLDDELEMQIPRLTLTLESTTFLYGYLLENEGTPGIFAGSPASATAFYTRYYDEGREYFLNSATQHSR